MGYYVNNDYADEQMRLEPPPTVQVSQLQRHILADKPRVTRFPIPWDNSAVPQSTATSGGVAAMHGMDILPGAVQQAAGGDAVMVVGDL